jgi:hypothetical protein
VSTWPKFGSILTIQGWVGGWEKVDLRVSSIHEMHVISPSNARTSPLLNKYFQVHLSYIVSISYQRIATNGTKHRISLTVIMMLGNIGCCGLSKRPMVLKGACTQSISVNFGRQIFKVLPMGVLQEMSL